MWLQDMNLQNWLGQRRKDWFFSRAIGTVSELKSFSKSHHNHRGHLPEIFGGSWGCLFVLNSLLTSSATADKALGQSCKHLGYCSEQFFCTCQEICKIRDADPPSTTSLPSWKLPQNSWLGRIRLLLRRLIMRSVFLPALPARAYLQMSISARA